MPDYYAILWRALRKGDFQSVRWRESVFDQTRQMLRDQLRNTRPPMSPTDIRHHSAALEGAIEAIRSELAQGAAAGAETQRPRPSGGRTGDISAIGQARSRAGAPRSFPTLISSSGPSSSRRLRPAGMLTWLPGTAPRRCRSCDRGRRGFIQVQHRPDHQNVWSGAMARI